MKKSLFKKNEIGMKDTSRYVIPWGMVPDSEFADDHQDYDTDEPV